MRTMLVEGFTQFQRIKINHLGTDLVILRASIFSDIHDSRKMLGVLVHNLWGRLFWWQLIDFRSIMLGPSDFIYISLSSSVKGSEPR